MIRPAHEIKEEAERKPPLQAAPPEPIEEDEKKISLFTFWLWFLLAAGLYQFVSAQDSFDAKLGGSIFILATALLWFRSDED